MPKVSINRSSSGDGHELLCVKASAEARASIHDRINACSLYPETSVNPRKTTRNQADINIPSENTTLRVSHSNTEDVRLEINLNVRRVQHHQSCNGIEFDKAESSFDNRFATNTVGSKIKLPPWRTIQKQFQFPWEKRNHV